MRVLPKRFRALVLSAGALALLGWITADGQTATPAATAPNTIASNSSASSSSAPTHSVPPAVAPNTEIQVLD
ncbi:MAG: hypothetical protein WA430_12235, partial [Acidobacteriaceae bacterium]